MAKVKLTEKQMGHILGSIGDVAMERDPCPEDEEVRKIFETAVPSIKEARVKQEVRNILWSKAHHDPQVQKILRKVEPGKYDGSYCTLLDKYNFWGVKEKVYKGLLKKRGQRLLKKLMKEDTSKDYRDFIKATRG